MPPGRAWIVATRRPQSPQYVEYWSSLRPFVAAMERIPGDEARSAKPSQTTRGYYGRTTRWWRNW